MRGLRSKLQRRLRLLLACLVLSLAVAPPLLGVAITPAVAALVSVADPGPHSGARAGTSAASACERRAQESGARWHVPVRWNAENAALVAQRAALVAQRALFGSSREAAFDGQRLYLRHLALLC